MSRLFLRGLLLAVACVATLVYWEYGVRVLGDAAFPLLRTDKEVGSIHVKNFDGMAWSANAGAYRHIRTNNLGYNGYDVAPEKPKGTVRIAIMGDSVTAGLEVDTDNNFSSLLQSRLNAGNLCPTLQFEVMNFGVGASGTFLQYQTFKRKIAPLTPDYTLVVMNDDYADNLNKSQYSLENFADERRAVGLKSLLLEFSLPKFLFAKLQHNELIRSVLQTLGLLEVAPTEFRSIADSNSNSLPENYYSHTFDLVTKLNELTTSHNSRLILIPYPPASNFAGTETWKNDPSVTNLIAFAEKSRIELWNPIPGIVQGRITHKECIVANCSDHLNEAGHKIMADILYDFFTKRLREDLPRACPRT